MRVPLRWLQEFIDLPTTDIAELSYAFDMLGLTVDGIGELEADWSDVYVGKVEAIEAHPDADKIRICQVDSGIGPTQIICGAWNFDEGATVAVARPGAVLPGDFRIAQRTIRGVDSHGMICSERELGLGADHAGILVLDDSLEVGVPFSEVIELPDVVFELDVPPNRPDALSMVGVARDLSAHFGIGYRVPEVRLETVPGQTDVSVEIQDESGCRRFTAREIKDVTVGPSPFGLRHRLHKVGVRPISNVVDVTNYVMFELGHPLHAFDADEIVGDRLVVRRASEGESLTTLDGESRALHGDDLIIYDDAGPTSMSGTMGGERSEVGESTSRVLMEAASWDPPTIMHMWRRHDLRSEAATRFERGVDPNLADTANRRASAMVADLARGHVIQGAVDVVTRVIEPALVELHIEEVERILGPGFTVESVSDILTRLGMGVEGEKPMKVTVPTFRPDVERPADLIEEIARIHGFDKFDATIPTGPAGGLSIEQRRARQLRAALASAGLYHAVNLPFVSPRAVTPFDVDPDDLLTIKNPLREQESKLRPSLLPGLLEAVRYNQSHGASSVGLFEVGNVFGSEPGEEEPRLPTEYERVAWVIVGDVGLRRLGSSQDQADASFSLAVWRHLAQRLDLSADVVQATAAGFHPGRTARLEIDGTAIGHVGELAPSTARLFEIDGRVAAAELDVAPLIAPVPVTPLGAPSVFPHVDFDLSFLFDRDGAAADLVEVTSSAAGELVEDTTVFDEYFGTGIPDGRRALAIRYRLRAPDRTLDQAEISSIRDAMISAASGVGAELRGA